MDVKEFREMYDSETIRGAADLVGRPALLPVTTDPNAGLPKIVIFHHVIMSGGSSINDVIHAAIEIARTQGSDSAPRTEMRYGSHAAFHEPAVFQNDADRLLLVGHDMFGLHAIAPQSTGYIGMLRDPVDLFLSRFVSREMFPGPTGDRVDGWKNIETRVDELASIAGHLNQQCCEHSHFRTAEKIYAEFWAETPEELFAKAKANIDEHFLLMGIKELYEETIIAMCDLLSLPVVPVWRPGLRNSWRPRRHDIPVSLLRKLESLMEADIELYYACRAKFEEHLADKKYGQTLDSYKSEAGRAYVKFYQELSDRMFLARENWGRNSDVFKEEVQHINAIIGNLATIRDGQG